MHENNKTHWQRVYGEKRPTELSWYQAVPEQSLQLIRSSGIAKSEPILDVGGGASTLVDHLLDEGYMDISVLDISGRALKRSRARLGELAGRVKWIEADVTQFEPSRQYALCHDRAVFHFLTESADRQKYIEVICRALEPRGNLVLATFGPDGPSVAAVWTSADTALSSCRTYSAPVSSCVAKSLVSIKHRWAVPSSSSIRGGGL